MKPGETLLSPWYMLEYAIPNVRAEICFYFQCILHNKEL